MRTLPSVLSLALISSIASASAPSHPSLPGTCSRVPARIVLVGSNGVQPDVSQGSFEVAVCRFSLPLQGAQVAVTHSANAAGVRLGRETDPAPTFATCPDQVLRFFTDATGTTGMTLTGSVDLGQQAPGVAPTVSIYADGVWFGDVPVVCYDLDGTGGVGAGDLSAWLTLFGAGDAILVADYNGSGVLDADDLSRWFDVFGSGFETVSATPLCP